MTIEDYLKKTYPPYGNIKVEKRVSPISGNINTEFKVDVIVHCLIQDNLEFGYSDTPPAGAEITDGSINPNSNLQAGTSTISSYKLRFNGSGRIRLPPAVVSFNGYKVYSDRPIVNINATPNFQVISRPPLPSSQHNPPHPQQQTDSNTCRSTIDESDTNENESDEELDQEKYITLNDLGGISEIKKEINKYILNVLRNTIKRKLLRAEPQNILLYGPSGTGKTTLAIAIANELDLPFRMVSSATLQDNERRPETVIEQIVKEAEQIGTPKKPAIVFLDDLDTFVPRRSEHNMYGNSIAGAFLKVMDEVSKKRQKKVIFVGATNHPDALDEALRRRFDKEIFLGPPNEKGRLEILKIKLKEVPLKKEVNLETLAEETHGCTGADLEQVVSEAKALALEEKANKISMEHLLEAAKNVSPSALREYKYESPNLTFEDIGGYEIVKKEIKEKLVPIFEDPEFFKESGITPNRGAIFYGPPGTGKTLFAKAIASTMSANFISIKGPEIKSKWVGASEENIRKIFRIAKSAKPCIICIDEIDSIAPSRSGDAHDSGVSNSIVTQLLTLIDGLEEMDGIFVIGTTNRIELIDPALKRPNRLELHFYIGNPNLEDRIEIFKVHTRKMKNLGEIDFKELAENTEGKTGAFIQSVCREAVFS
ncbi:MAG: AAA family ATPase, partial [Methanosarcinales archaeon]